MPSSWTVQLYRYRAIFFAIVASSLILPIKINSILLILYFLYWFIVIPNPEKKNGFKQNKKYLLLYLLFFLFNGLSLFYSEDVAGALKDIEGKLGLLILPIILFAQKPFTKTQFKQSLLVFAISISLASLTAVTISLIQFQGLLANQELAALIGMHASYLGLYVAFSFFIILHYYLENKQKIYLLPLLILFLSLIFLSARIILLGFILVNVIWFVGRGFSLKKLMYGVVGFVVIAVISWNYEPIKTRLIEAVNFEDKVELDTDPDLHLTIRPYGGRAIRVAIWTCSQDVLKEYWLTGVGIGDVHTHLQQSYKDHAFEFAWKHNNYNAHNLFIETTIAFGISGVILLLLLFYQLFYWALKRKNLPFFAFSLLFLGISFMESTMNVHRGIIFFAVFSPMLLAYSSSSPEETK